MRSVILFEHVSLDSFAAGPKGALDWITYDKELEQYAASIVSETDTALYGRLTFEMMKSTWPPMLSDPDASKHDRDHARWIEQVEKVVFSTKMKTADWNNTTIVGSNIKKTIMGLKKKTGNNITIFGSPTLAQRLIQLDLIDEYRLTVNQVVLARGKSPFKNLKGMRKLKLVEAKTFKCGTVGFHYLAQRD